MSVSRYALAVQVDDSFFEIFDILDLEKNEERDLRYKAGILNGSKVINPKDTSGIKIGSFWNGSKFIPDSFEDCLEIDEDHHIYTFLSENKIFGFMINAKGTFIDEKFQAALDLNVILINVNDDDIVNLGDIWDGNSFKKVDSLI